MGNVDQGNTIGGYTLIGSFKDSSNHDDPVWGVTLQSRDGTTITLYEDDLHAYLGYMLMAIYEISPQISLPEFIKKMHSFSYHKNPHSFTEDDLRKLIVQLRGKESDLEDFETAFLADIKPAADTLDWRY